MRRINKAKNLVKLTLSMAVFAIVFVVMGAVKSGNVPGVAKAEARNSSAYTYRNNNAVLSNRSVYRSGVNSRNTVRPAYNNYRYNRNRYNRVAGAASYINPNRYRYKYNYPHIYRPNVVAGAVSYHRPYYNYRPSLVAGAVSYSYPQNYHYYYPTSYTPNIVAGATSYVYPGSYNYAGATNVSISNFAFQPANIRVSSGSTVVWTNNDIAAHTVTSYDGSFGSGVLLPGQSYSKTFSYPGNYSYYCNIHPEMVGSVMVGGGYGYGYNYNNSNYAPPLSSFAAALPESNYITPADYSTISGTSVLGAASYAVPTTVAYTPNPYSAATVNINQAYNPVINVNP